MKLFTPVFAQMKRSENRYGVAAVEVDVREIDDAAAPVVAVQRNPLTYVLGERGKMTFRHFDGDFWKAVDNPTKPIPFDYGLDRSSALSLGKSLEPWSDRRHPLGTSRSEFTNTMRRFHSPEAPPENLVAESPMLPVVRECARHVICVEGVLYRRCEGPLISLSVRSDEWSLRYENGLYALDSMRGRQGAYLPSDSDIALEVTRRAGCRIEARGDDTTLEVFGEMPPQRFDALASAVETAAFNVLWQVRVRTSERVDRALLATVVSLREKLHARHPGRTLPVSGNGYSYWIGEHDRLDVPPADDLIDDLRVALTLPAIREDLFHRTELAATLSRWDVTREMRPPADLTPQEDLDAVDFAFGDRP